MSQKDCWVNLVYEMNEIVLNFNDEEIVMYWLQEGVADGSTLEDLQYDVDTREDFEDFAETFLYCVKVGKERGEDFDEFARNIIEQVEKELGGKR